MPCHTRRRPYLLQHRTTPSIGSLGATGAGPRATENKPLLVSIGYTACHWCHVMERESFEDPEIAAVMNDRFVCIKVDREERPDVDAIYMDAVQAMTGHGGWPLNAFLTPDGVPFFAGTYFPPEPRHGMPAGAGARRRRATRGDAARRDRHRRSGILPRLRARRRSRRPRPARPGRARRRGDRAASAPSTPHYGGWGGAPKFPSASAIEFLLRAASAQMALQTLRRMAGGGIYDQIGGGFARYSVDARWIVPHFEKMLYDNALLARAYLHALAGQRASRCFGVCARRSTSCCASCARTRAASRARSTPTPRASRASSTCGRSTSCAPRSTATRRRRDRALRRHRGGQLRRRERSSSAPRPIRPEQREIKARLLPRASAGAAGARRQAADGVERADDLRAGRRRRRAGARGLRRRRGRPARASSSASCATPPAACCAPSTPGRRSSRPSWRTTRSCSRRFSPSTRRRSTSGGSRARARARRRRSSSALPTPTVASSRRQTTTSSLSPAARTSRTPRSRRARRRPALGLLRLAR